MKAPASLIVIPYSLIRKRRSGISLGRLHMGGICPPPPYGGGTGAGDRELMGGLMRGDIDLIGGT